MVLHFYTPNQTATTVKGFVKSDCLDSSSPSDILFTSVIRMEFFLNYASLFLVVTFSVLSGHGQQTLDERPRPLQTPSRQHSALKSVVNYLGNDFLLKDGCPEPRCDPNQVSDDCHNISARVPQVREIQGRPLKSGFSKRRVTEPPCREHWVQSISSG